MNNMTFKKKTKKKLYKFFVKDLNWFFVSNMVIFSVDTNNNLWFRERKQITTTSKDAFASHYVYASGIISLLTIVYLYTW